MTFSQTIILMLSGLILSLVSSNTPSSNQDVRISFSDTFEDGSGKWDFNMTENVEIIDSGDPMHSQVLALTPGGEFVRALIKGSEGWNKYKIEADFRFPTSGHSYFGLIYHYNRTDARIDFGSLYVKGNGSYIRVNPRRDYNAQRTLYEEYKTPLTGADAIVIGQWHHFKAEVIDSVCHFYVDDMVTPKVTFDAFEFNSGRLGFKPRVVGEPVWIDNVIVSAISNFSYSGPNLPEGIIYQPENLLTDWHVMGPFCGTVPELENDGFLPEKSYSERGSEYRWKRFLTDKRGCVVSGRLTEFIGGRNVAYFYTTVHAEEKQTAILHISSNEQLAIWFNDEFLGYDDAARYAWYDFWKNSKHEGVRGQVELDKGENALLIRVRGGKYAGGGFFAHIDKKQSE